MTLYQQLVEAGVEISNHYSDMYVKATPESTSIINKFRSDGNLFSSVRFKNNIDGTMWYDIPFLYDPYWEEKSKRK